MKKSYNVSILQFLIKELKGKAKPEQLAEFKNANKDFELEANEEVFLELSNARLESMITKIIDYLRKTWIDEIEKGIAPQEKQPEKSQS